VDIALNAQLSFALFVLKVKKKVEIKSKIKKLSWNGASTEALPGLWKVCRANEEVPDMQRTIWKQMVRPMPASRFLSSRKLRVSLLLLMQVLLQQIVPDCRLAIA
jgi:hypothetical protein